MFNKKITRAEFLKVSLIGILSFLALPALRRFFRKDNTARKDARYYKNLAG